MNTSMGPRPFGRGNWGSGHGQKSCQRVTSMGPRPFGRGNWPGWKSPSQVTQTSMGPTAFRSRKSHRDELPKDKDETLQWGRGLSVAEMQTASKRPSVLRSLQWGRGLSVAEIRSNEPLESPIVNTSMGPRPFGRGNARWMRSSSAYWKATSMGPRPFGRGNGSSGMP